MVEGDDPFCGFALLGVIVWWVIFLFVGDLMMFFVAELRAIVDFVWLVIYAYLFVCGIGDGLLFE